MYVHWEAGGEWKQYLYATDMDKIPQPTSQRVNEIVIPKRRRRNHFNIK